LPEKKKEYPVYNSNFVIRLTLVFLFLVMSNCWFGAYQSAKLLHDGEHSVDQKLTTLPCLGLIFNCETGFAKIKIIPEVRQHIYIQRDFLHAAELVFHYSLEQYGRQKSNNGRAQHLCFCNHFDA